MARNLIVGAAALVLGFVATPHVRGQDSLLDELYGQGVHAYFARDYESAQTSLNAAIEGGTRDPRAYYFRGLTLMVLGKTKEGAADFKAGAALEVAATDRAYGVPRSLERIQGPVRRSIEAERQLARVSLRQKLVDRNKARYEQLDAAEKIVERNGSASKPAPGDIPKLPAPKDADPDDPFGGVEGTEAPKPEMPDEPAPTPDEPDAEKPAEPAKPEPAGDDPFGEEKPAAPAKPAPVPAKPDGDDPFGEDPPAEKPAPAAPEKPDPAAAEEPEPAAPEKPAEKPAAPEDDPFGGAAAAPAPKKGAGGGLLGSMFKAVAKSLPAGEGDKAAPPAAPPAAGAKDPFADDPAPAKPAAPAAPAAPPKPAAPADDDDPFK